MEQEFKKKESTVKDFLEVIFRRKWIIVGIVLVSTVLVLVMNTREPAVYESMARILVKRGEAMGVFNPYVRTLTWEEEIASQIEMVKSQVVVDRAQEILHRFVPEGYETDEQINVNNVNSDVVSTSNVIWVTYTSRDPVFCRVAVNAMVNAYRDYYQQVRTPPEMEDFFANEKQILMEEIEYWRERKQRVESEWGIIDLNRQRTDALQQLWTLRNELGDIVQERRERESILETLETLEQADVAELSAISTGLLEPGQREGVVENLRRRLIDLKMQESDLAARYTDSNKELVNIRAQIDDMHGLLSKEIDALLFVNRSRLSVVRDRERSLRSDIARLESENEEFPAQEVELQRIETSLQNAIDSYEALVEQHINSRISIASNPEWNVTILNPADSAHARKTRDYVRIALGPLFSLVIALGFAFFIDNLDHSIKNVSEAEDVLQMNVLASFPDTKR
ncbi:MAG: hypothetical protein JW876_03690 [Candidatus Krumholzibacteriota bacterium]|nr:hypothetical protein [Candidatus Krumholzibacteriota bacterium]